MDYHARVAAHLSRYKEFHLGIRGGQTGQRAVLPDEYRDLNILPEYRRPFRHYAHANPMFRLAADFADLKSSQALCFNLFIPFAQDTAKQGVLTTLLSGTSQSLTQTGFDFSFGPAIEEYFDFFCRFADGSEVYFDIKYAETWFGPAHQSGISSDALFAASRSDITGLVAGTVLKSPEIAKLIVLLKKLAFVVSRPSARFCCIFPADNTRLRAAMDLLQRSLYRTVEERLMVFSLEDFLMRLIDTAGVDTELGRYFQRVQAKYVPTAAD